MMAALIADRCLTGRTAACWPLIWVAACVWPRVLFAVPTTATGFYYPTDASTPSVTSGVGADRGTSWHCGADINADKEDAVYAIAPGTVVDRREGGWNSGSTGNVGIVVRHTLANETKFLAVYGHIVSDLQVGNGVTAGVQIGKVGYYQQPGGTADWSHLHFGIYEHSDGKGTAPLIDSTHGWGLRSKPTPGPETIGGVTAYDRWFDPVAYIRNRSPSGGSGGTGSLRVYAEEWSNGSFVRKFSADFQVSRVGGGVVQGWTKTTTDGYLVQNLDPGDYRVEWGTYKDDGGGSVPIDPWWRVPGPQTATVEANNTRDVWGHYERADWWPQISSRNYSGGLTLESGQEAVLEVFYTNRGWQTWRNYGGNQTNLGTWDPQDRNSVFATDDWLGGNRPGPADQSDIGAEGQGRFAFRIRAPQVTAPTDYREAFALVAENVRWLNDIGDAWKVEWNIHVNPPPKGTLSVTTNTNSPVTISGEVFVNGTSWGVAPQPRQLDVGTYTVTFGAVGGWNTPPAQSATVTSNNTTNVVGTYTDTTPPTISSYSANPPSPSNASVVRIEVTASDAAAGLDRVEVWVDGAKKGNAPLNWDTTGVADGNHAITLKAVDRANPANVKEEAFSYFLDKTPPTTPTNLVGAHECGQVTLTWDASTDPGAPTTGSGLSGYTVHRAEYPGGSFSKTATVNDATTAFTDTSLANLAAYTYHVTAFDRAGNESSAAEIIHTVGLLGDISGDCSVDVQDMVKATRLALYLDPGTYVQRDLGDVNRDAAVDVADVVKITNLSLGRAEVKGNGLQPQRREGAKKEGSGQDCVLSLPEKVEGAVEGTIEVPVRISGGAVGGVQCAVAFDPKLLTVESVAPGTLGGEGWSLDSNVLDGKVLLMLHSSAMAPIAPKEGDTIAVLRFTATGNAASGETIPLSFVDITKVVDEAGEALPLATKNGAVEIAGSQYSQSEVAAGWNMVSVPLRASSPSPVSIFGDNLPSVLTYGWAGTTYAPNPDLAPGVGCWLFAPQATTVDAAGESVSEGESFAVPLKQGWNLIGCPFRNLNVAWSDASVRYAGETRKLMDAGEWLSPVLYTWDTKTASYSLAVTPAGTIEPWKAYWVLALKDCDLLIPPTDSGHGQAVPTSAFRNPGSEGWGIPLRVTSDGRSEEITARVSPSATEGYDGAGVDIAVPPASPEPSGVHLFFPRPSWRAQTAGAADVFCVDTRGPVTRTTVWVFEVVQPQIASPKSQILLTWPDLTQVPKDYRLTLYDVDAGVRRYMRTTSSYAFAAQSGQARHFQLVVQPTLGNRLTITNVAARSLAGRRLELAYTLSDECEVWVRLLAANGRAVLQLPPRNAQRGLNRAALETKERATRGVYLLEVVARTEEGQTARAMRRVVVR